MIVEDANLVDRRCGGSDGLSRGDDVFTVLTAAGIGTVGRGKDGKDSLHSVGGHLSHGVGQQRMPVAVAPIDRQVDPGAIEFRSEGGDEVSHLSVDRTDTVEVVVMLGDFEHPFTRDRLATQHVFEERDHVVSLLGTTEGDDQDGVVVVGHEDCPCEVTGDEQEVASLRRARRWPRGYTLRGQ